MLEYDNEVFWENLAGRLAERDLRRRHGEAGFEAMDDDAMNREMDPIYDMYSEEFESNGIDNIEIVRNSPPIKP